MFSHIMLGADDIKQSKKFYDAILAELGCAAGVIDDKGRCFYVTESGIFAITKPINGEPASAGNGSTVGFSAETPAQADAWYKVGLANGGSACEDAPGVRESGVGNLYLAYLRDPTGNKICALHRM